MIANSSLFKHLVNTHIDIEKRENIIQMISIYENIFSTRVKLQNITHSNYIEVMNSSIESIEKSDKILSLVRQLEFSIKNKLESVKKRYDIEQIRVSNMIENSELINDIKTKTDKDKTKKFLLKEQLLEIEQELSDLKTDVDTSAIFVNDAENFRELTYAYYQAVKRLDTLRG